MLDQLRHKCWPIFLNEALAHEGDTFEEKRGKFVVWTSHEQADKVLLENSTALVIDPVGRVILVTHQAL